MAQLVDAIVLVQTSGWLSGVLPTVFAVAVLARARAVRSVWQRGCCLFAGTLGLVVVVLTWVVTLPTGARIALVAVLLAVAVALGAGARLLPTRRPLPVWGQLLDAVELWTALALVPLVLALTGTFAFFRGLFG
jgi:hypothetical protein